MSAGLAETRVIGLDVHPDTFTAAAVRGREARKASVDWIRGPLPIEKMALWAAKNTHASDVLVLEAGSNSFEMVERLREVGRTALVLESLRAGQIRKTYCTTDHESAVKLARVYLSGLAVHVWVPDEKTRARRELFHRYQGAKTDAVRHRNRLRSFLCEHGVKIPRGFRWFANSTLDELLKLRSWSSMQQELLGLMFGEFRQSTLNRKRLNRMMAAEVVSDPQLLELIRLFGVRHIVAFALGAFIGDIRRFRTPKQLVAYIGLNPRVHLSGKGGYVGSLAHHGRWDLRSILVEAAHAILRHSNPIRNWGLRLAMAKGKQCAVVAVARKLVVACWYLLQGCFTPLKEIDATLKTKIHKIATVLGRANVQQLGFDSIALFEKGIHLQLLKT